MPLLQVLEPQGVFASEDFGLLEHVEGGKVEGILKPIKEQRDWPGLDPDDVSADFLSTLTMGASSALSARARAGGLVRFDSLKATSAMIVKESQEAFLHMDGVVDPLSAEAQRITPLLVLLHDWFDTSLRIFMNPSVSQSAPHTLQS